MDIVAIFNAFKNRMIPLGHVDYDLQFGDQCVDLLRCYWKDEFNIGDAAGGVEYATDYWYHTPAGLLAKFDKIATTNVQIGDSVIFNFNHIGIATGVQTATTVEVLNQNAGKLHDGDGVGDDAIRTQSFNKTGILGVLRAKGAVITAAAPATPWASQNVGRFLNLPAAAATWRVYNPASPSWTANPDTSKAKLSPAKYATNGYLTYKILGNPRQDWYLIQTSMYGQVAIYGAASTEAVISDSDLSAPSIPVVPAPVSAPAPARQDNIVYTRLETPMNLVTNKQPTHWWALNFTDDANAVSQAELAINTPFTAYGKAQRTDGDKPCYYMIEADFGQADTTGIPVNNNGVNTVDLSPAPIPAPAVPQATQISTGLATASAPMSPIVPVKPPEDMSWKKTIKNIADYEYDGTVEYDVVDLLTGIATTALMPGQTVHAAVRFLKPASNGKVVEYVMTQKSIDAGKYNGVPLSLLTLVKPIDIGLDSDNLLDDLDMKEIGYKIKDAADVASKIIDPIVKNKTLREWIVTWVARIVFRSKKQKI